MKRPSLSPGKLFSITVSIAGGLLLDPAAVFSPDSTSPALVAAPQRVDSLAPDHHGVFPPTSPMFVSVFYLLGPPKTGCRSLTVAPQVLWSLP